VILTDTPPDVNAENMLEIKVYKCPWMLIILWLSKGLGRTMKEKIHPAYAETTITCACGSVLKVNSTGKNLHLNTCSVCHPFFTGKTALADSRGRVEQFRKRYKQQK